MAERLGHALAHTHTGEAYFRHITSQEPDRRVRAAFQQLILDTAPARAALLDFGAGPGIDARFFAERGFTVHAYDVDPAMADFFANHCADLIDAGRVTLQRGSYADFLSPCAPAPSRPVDLILSNFAPLNLIEDLGALFARFHALAAPNGRVLASVINPYCWADMKYPWWWRKLPELRRKGRYVMPGPQAPHMRRGLADFAQESAPYFRLTRIFPGFSAGSRQAPAGLPTASAGRMTWWRLRAGRFMFLQFDR